MVEVAAEASGGSLDGKRVLALGVSYQGDVKESAFSGVFQLMDLLQRRGAVVTVSDPLFSHAELRGLGLQPHQRGNRTDVVMAHTDHAAFRSFGVEDFPGATVVVDSWNILDPARFSRVGLLTLGRGRPRLRRRDTGPDTTG